MTLLGILVALIAVAGSIAVWVSKPARAVGVFIAIVLAWPESRTIRLLGTLDFSVGQIMVFALLAALALKSDRILRVRPNLLDFVIILAVLCQMVSAATHMSFSRVLESQGNELTRTALAYFAVRIGVTSRDDLFCFLRSLVYAGIPLALLGVFESLTGFNVYESLCLNLAGHHFARVYPMRHGLHRALGSFGNPIPWSLFMAGMIPISAALRFDPAWSLRRGIAAGFIFLLGMYTGVSSGGLFAALIMLAVMAFYPVRPLLLPVIACTLLIAGTMQFIGPACGLPSFTEFVTRFSLDANSGAYRMGLVGEAFHGGMRGHWIFGYGLVGLGVEAESGAFHWSHTDFVNLYIYKLVVYGLVGMVPYLIMVGVTFARLGVAIQCAMDRESAWLTWCFLSLVLGWQIAFLTVSPMTQFATLYYAILGVVAGLSGLVAVAYDEREDAALLPDTALQGIPL